MEVSAPPQMHMSTLYLLKMCSPTLKNITISPLKQLELKMTFVFTLVVVYLIGGQTGHNGILTLKLNLILKVNVNHPTKQ